MNGESDKPAAVLIGIADEDASELPPLQPPKSSGKAKKTRQIPNAGILNPELDASNGMSLSYPARESEAQGEPCSIRITRAPDVTVEIPRNACGFLEFWRAEELIALGRERTARAFSASEH